jgi:hypothetical protein
MPVHLFERSHAIRASNEATNDVALMRAGTPQAAIGTVVSTRVSFCPVAPPKTSDHNHKRASIIGRSRRRLPIATLGYSAAMGYSERTAPRTARGAAGKTASLDNSFRCELRKL